MVQYHNVLYTVQLLQINMNQTLDSQITQPLLSPTHKPSVAVFTNMD